MKKQYLITCISLLLSGIVIAQPPGTSCGQKEVTQRFYNNTPSAKLFQLQVEKQLQEYTGKVNRGILKPQQTNAVTTLPVVVHIIHNNGPENISDAIVFTAIQHLNEAFANTGYYDPLDGVNTDIQFCLAQRDPNNNPTNGIDRIVSPLTVMDGFNNSSQDIAVKNLSRWDPKCYINIWIVKEITGPVAGYAYLPSAHGMNIDGIVGEAAYFGSSYPNDVLIIHEMGHYLGLYHTFQGGCTNNDCSKDGDQVCDTPPDQSTAGIGCNSTANSCSTDALSGFATDVNDLHQDYLDYGNWNCMKVFTQGQSNRMNWMIQNVRKSLLSCKSCMLPCPAPVTANFSSSANAVSVGATVNFTNSSVNASGYKWYINNVLQSGSTNFSYTFNTVGTYIIKLWALTNNPLCDSAVRFDTVRVICPVVAAFTPTSGTYNVGQTVNFVNSSVGASSYQWIVNNVVQGTATNFSSSFSIPGFYTISLLASNGFCADSIDYYFTILDTIPTPPADSCGRSTFQKTLRSIHGLESYSIEPTADGGTIIGGMIRYSDRIQVDAMAIKLTAGGNVQWARAMSDIYFSEFYKVRQTRDGGYIAVGVVTTSDNVSGICLVRLTPAGTIIWSKRFATGKPISDHGTDVIELSSGGFAITGNSLSFSTTSHGLLIITDGNGTITWTKRLYANNGTRFHSVIEVADTLVVAGDNYITSSNIAVGNITKFNKNSGAIYTSRSFRMNGRGNYSSKIFKTGYGYFIASYIMEYLDWLGKNLGLLKLDNNLNALSGLQLSRIDQTLRASAMPVGDTGFIAAAADNNGLLLYNINPTNTSLIQWKKSYGNAISGASDHHPVNPLFLAGGYFIGASTYKELPIGNSSKKSILLTKTDIQGNTPGCETQIPPESVAPVNVVIEQLVWNDISTYNPIDPTIINFTVKPIVITVDTICNTCDTLPPPPTDTCRSITFQKKIGSTENDIATDIKVTPFGEYLISGSTNNNSGVTSNNYEALLIKLNRYGNKLWQKTIGGADTDIFTKLLVLKNGNYLSWGISKSLHSKNGTLLLINTDTAGNILWQKEHHLQAQSLTELINISGAVELADGSIAFCGNAKGINTDVGQPLETMYNIIGRVDISGNMIWVKRLRYYYWESGYSMPGLIATGNALIAILGDGVLKVSQADGSLIGLQRQYQNAGLFSSIEKNGSKVILYSPIHRIELDTNLNLLAGTRYNSAIPGSNFAMLGTSSEKGSVMQGVIIENLITAGTYITRYSESGETIGTYKFPFTKAGQPAMTGSRITNDNGIFLANLTQEDYFAGNNNNGDIYVARTDSLVKIPDCPRSSFQTYSSQLQPPLAELTIRFYPLTNTTYTTTLQPQSPSITIENLCAGNCSVLQISGQDTICNLSDTVIFQAQRNQGCNALTDWYIDSSFATIISVTDSTISLQFKKSGSALLYGTINTSCKIIVDSFPVTIITSPDSLKLGPDIQLCKISTYTIKAGTGFKSYQWQDGSTDSTLTIYTPGTYHVTAEDYCGKLLRDTIVVSQSPDIPFDLGADLAKCNTDTLTITAPAGFAKYYWSPNYKMNNSYLQSTRVAPDRDTMYTVIAEKSPGCLVTDSIRIIVNKSAPVNLGNDTGFCVKDSITITAANGFSNYIWNTGAITQSIRASAIGNYSVAATDSNGCISRDTLQILTVYPLPAISLGDDFSICSNSIHQFDAGNFASYLWQDGSANKTFSTSQTGTYWVRVKNSNGCTNTDTASIISYLKSPSGFLDEQAEICVNQRLELKAAGGYNKYRWFNNSGASTVTVTAPGDYWLEVTNTEGCTARDTILVKAKDCIKGIFFPNAFTPGNGGNNNLFRPIVYGGLERFYMAVYNRWGQKIFETRDFNKGWDGTVNGVQQDTGTFAWTASYTFSGTNEKPQIKKGTITLIR